ncbi:hypothetical protein SMICM304S_11146 [Streptomyces microflavus]
MAESAAVEFRIDRRSGVATYLQIVQQTKQALRLGVLQPGDRLPTAREVVEATAINPNTVLKAYRELEREGLVEARRGLGTFVGAGRSAPRPGHPPLDSPRAPSWPAWARRATVGRAGEGRRRPRSSPPYWTAFAFTRDQDPHDRCCDGGNRGLGDDASAGEGRGPVGADGRLDG